MVLNNSKPDSPTLTVDKENLACKTSSTDLCSTHGRRPLSGTDNASSHIVAWLDTITNPHCHAQSPAAAVTGVATPVPPAPDIQAPDEDIDVPMTEIESSMSESSDSEVEKPSAANALLHHFRLPKRLKRPGFQEVSREAIERVNADLKGVNTESIIDNLQAIGEKSVSCVSYRTAQAHIDFRLLSIMKSTTPITLPRNGLPRTLEVKINDLSAEAPTHVVAVYSRPLARVTLHPIHALILIVHCAHLPIFPNTASPPPTEVGGTRKLPVVPICLQNTETFPTLLQYLYTKRPEYVLAALLPLRPRDTKQSPRELAEAYATTFTCTELVTFAAKVHMLWCNVGALGIFDEILSRNIDLVWWIMLVALIIRTRSDLRDEEASSQS